jgi:hypothetical protein
MPNDNEQQWYPVEYPPGPTYLVFALSTWFNKVPNRLEDLNSLLAGAGWSLTKESDLGQEGTDAEAITEPVVIPLRLAPLKNVMDAETTPQGALRVFRDTEARQRLQLDQLLIDGLPAHKGGALTRGDFDRVPVAVMTPSPPRRRGRDEMPERRRPVIALFDTAISRHPWLDTADTADTAETADPIWLDAEDYGCKLGLRAPARGESRGLMSSWKGLESDFGHGTFSAGLIRQIAPDALILLFRVMHDDGSIDGDHILNALGWIRDGGSGRTSREEADVPADIQNPGRHVDVICLPLGYTSESKDAKFTKWLGEVLGDLGDRGVQVVASAGNDGTDEPVYPAAFVLTDKQPHTPLVSVGALNPNGRTHAHYSNHGGWVTDWVVGTSVVSTFPLVDGAANAEVGGEGSGNAERGGEANWESVDPDDFTGGFSRWSGTSFAATAFAGMLGQALLTPDALAARTPHERAEIALRICRQGA